MAALVDMPMELGTGTLQATHLLFVGVPTRRAQLMQLVSETQDSTPKGGNGGSSGMMQADPQFYLQQQLLQQNINQNHSIIRNHSNSGQNSIVNSNTSSNNNIIISQGQMASLGSGEVPLWATASPSNSLPYVNMLAGPPGAVGESSGLRPDLHQMASLGSLGSLSSPNLQMIDQPELGMEEITLLTQAMQLVSAHSSRQPSFPSPALHESLSL